jgi:hypothetical protein
MCRILSYFVSFPSGSIFVGGLSRRQASLIRYSLVTHSCTIYSETFAEVEADREAWLTAVEIERRLNQVPGLVDTGSHITMAAQRQTD